MKLQTKKETFIHKSLCALSNPISAQINILSLLLENLKDKLPQEEKDLIQLTLNSCEQTQRTLNNIMNNLKDEKFQLNYTKFDIIALLEKVISKFEMVLKYNGLKILFRHGISKNELVIIADYEKIKLAIENVLMNITNYPKNNTNIYIDLIKENNYAKIIFSHQTQGIKQELIDIILKNEIFTKNFSSIELSLILSLNFIKKIINSHLGSINIVKKSEDICEFILYIPIK